MEKQYQILCFGGKHVHVLGYEEMVKVFGRSSVEQYEENPARHPLYAPSCMECDEDDEQRRTELELHDLLHSGPWELSPGFPLGC